METPCKNCCFAMYRSHTVNENTIYNLVDKDSIKLTQSDCELGMLDKFREKGIEITEAYDDDCEFFVIHSVCPYFRNNNEKVEPLWKYHNDPDRLHKVESELDIKVSLMIYLTKNSTVKDLESTISSLCDLTVFPRELIIVSNMSSIVPSQIRRIIGNTIPYKIELTVEELPEDDCLNILSIKSSYQYISVVNVGEKLPHNIYTVLSDKIRNLEPFLVYIPKRKNNGLTINKLLFELVGRNTGKPFLEKLQNIPDWEKYTVYES